SIVAVAWASPETFAGTYVDSFPYDLGVSWSGASTITGTLHALQWTRDTNGLPNAYQGIGVKNNVALAAGSTVTSADMNLEIPATQTVTTTFSLPTGYTLAQRRADVTFADGAFFPVGQDQAAATGFSVLVPAGSGINVRVSAIAADASGSVNILGSLAGIAPGTTNATLTLPSPALPTLPAPATKGVDTTTDFRWSALTPYSRGPALAGGVPVVLFTGNSTGSPSFAIVTAGPTPRLPALSAQGLALPPAELYQWTVLGIAPLASVDAVAANGTFVSTG